MCPADWKGSAYSGQADFNRVAHAYRWLEYLTFGPVLQQTRVHFLSRLQDCRRALLFGDGDGRFLACLLAQNPHLTAEAVDTSQTMLTLLKLRAEPFTGHPAHNGTSTASTQAARLQTHNQSALTFTPTHPPDLVVTHFFLDCLTEPELDRLVQHVTPTLSPNALWVVSEFRIPASPFRLAARFLIRCLYFGFRLLTGLRVTRLPAYQPHFQQAGFVRIAHHHRFFGSVTAELWRHNSSA